MKLDKSASSRAPLDRGTGPGLRTVDSVSGRHCPRLSTRQEQILELIGDGLSDAEIVHRVCAGTTDADADRSAHAETEDAREGSPDGCGRPPHRKRQPG